MEQMSLFDAINGINLEMHSIYTAIGEALTSTGQGYDLTLLTEEHRTPEKSEAYDVIMLWKETLFKSSGKTTIRINVAPNTARILRKHGIPLEMQNTGWERLELKNLDLVGDPKIAEEIYESILSKDGFGCCSRYVECSDAKCCVQPDINLAIRCIYRKNLNAGRIFYGKNANQKIDDAMDIDI